MHAYTDSDYRGNVGVILFNHSDVDLPGAAPPPSLTYTHIHAWLSARRCLTHPLFNLAGSHSRLAVGASTDVYVTLLQSSMVIALPS